MTKERFFTIVELPGTITESYFVFGENIWWVMNKKATNQKGESFTVDAGDEIFEKYFFKVNEIDLIQAILKQMKYIIEYTNEKITDLIEMLTDDYEEEIIYASEEQRKPL
jgi:hypothetical protein